MNILFVCKASTKIGLGHLIRSRSLANQFNEMFPNLTISFKVVGEPLVSRLLTRVKYLPEIYEDEQNVSLNGTYDLCFIDMMVASDDFFRRMQDVSKLTISLSPIFNQMSRVDLLWDESSNQLRLAPSSLRAR